MFEIIKKIKEKMPEKIPEGGLYISSNNNFELKPGSKFPSEPSDNDEYTYGEYKYVFLKKLNGWNVELNFSKTNKYFKEYGPILENVGKIPVVAMISTFVGCKRMITAPVIPKYVQNISCAFKGCKNLTVAPVIPNGVINMDCAFLGCESMTEATNIPNSVQVMSMCFANCRMLSTPPFIPESVTHAYSAFAGCPLTRSLIVPQSILDAKDMFARCKLKTIPEGNIKECMFRDTSIDVDGYSVFIDKKQNLEYKSYRSGITYCVPEGHIVFELNVLRRIVASRLMSNFLATVKIA